MSLTKERRKTSSLYPLGSMYLKLKCMRKEHGENVPQLQGEEEVNSNGVFLTHSTSIIVS